MKEILYVRINNEREYENVIKNAESVKFQRIGETYYDFEKVKTHYHGNSQIIIELRFNSITKRCEWNVTNLKLLKHTAKLFNAKLKDSTDYYTNNNNFENRRAI